MCEKVNNAREIILTSYVNVERWIHLRTFGGYDDDEKFAAHLLTLEEKNYARFGELTEARRSNNLVVYGGVKAEYDNTITINHASLPELEPSTVEDLNYDIPTDILAEIQPPTSKKRIKKSKKSQLKCDFCGRKFKHSANLAKHKSRCRLNKNSSSNAVVNECELCGKRLPSSKGLLLHKANSCEVGKRVTVPADLTCPVCSKVLADKENYLIHQALAHSDVYSYECDVCGERFKIKKYLTRHRSKHGAQDVCMCAICNKKFHSVQLLKRHELRATCDGGVPGVRRPRKQTERPPNQCDLCNKTFSQAQALNNHRRMHNGQLVMCDLCGKGFVTETGMQKHRLTHEGKGRFKCDVCGKLFNRPGCMMEHKKRSHLGQPRERKFACEMCGNTFIARCYLEEHMNVHTGNKPHTCQHCGKSFHRKNEMRAHVRFLHLKEQTYYQRRKQKRDVNGVNLEQSA